MLQAITKENFMQMLGQFSTAELEDLTEKFPYFQQAHLLLAKKYQEERDSRFDQQLQLAALYTADRALLHEIFHENKLVATYSEPVIEEQQLHRATVEAVVEEKAIETAAEVEKSVEEQVLEPEALITVELQASDTELQSPEIVTTPEVPEEQIEQHAAPEFETVNRKPETEDTFSTREPHSFDEWLRAFSGIIAPETAVETKTDEEKDKELDRIIMQNTPTVHLEEAVEHDPRFSKGLEQFIEEQIEKHRHSEMSAPASENELDPALITETMAKVYEMQKKYARAIKAYETLALKFPEKVVYLPPGLIISKTSLNMYTFVIILIILVCILLGAVVLIQNPKGGGLSASFGGVGQQLLGARRSTDIVEKLTWGFAAALIVLCLSSTLFVDKKEMTKKEAVAKSEIEKNVANQPMGSFPAPGGNSPAPGAQPAGGGAPPTK